MPDAASAWHEDRTTFERVYDVLVGTHDHQPASAFADAADCSDGGARSALEQLVELGVATRRDGRPATYARNDAYFEWKRVESLARDHSAEALRSRVEDLVAADREFQDEYGVPTPDAVSLDVPVDDHEAFHDRLEDLQEWRTVRRDVRVVRRAAERAAERSSDSVGDGVQA